MKRDFRFLPVRKSAKLALIIPASLLVLALLLLFGANLYIQSSLSQGKLEAQLQRALHLPVKITSTTVSPWDGLTIRGIAIPQQDGVGNFLQADELKASLKLWPILHRQLIIKDLVFSHPQVEWKQTEKGRWVLPVQKATPTPAPSASPAEAPSASPAAPASSSVIVQSGKEKKAERPHFSVQIKHFSTEDGYFHFYDKDGMPQAFFDQVAVDSPNPLPVDGPTKGTVHIGSASIQQRVFFQEIETPFRYREGRVNLNELQARLAGGTLKGDFHIDPTTADSPFNTRVVFDGLDVHRLIAEAGGAPVECQGKLGGWFQAAGNSAHAKETIMGGGQLILSGGQVKNYTLLQTIGQALGIDELSVMNLTQAQANFRLAAKRVWIDSLLLQSQNLRLIVWGKAKYNGSLDLQAQLALNPKVQHQLPGFILKNFHPVPNTDLAAIDFTVTGSYRAPRTDLLKKALGSQFEKGQKALDLLRGFLGGKGN
ncbi:MAG: AsmA-like C-terminal region-containing protein [Chthoniobacteraceae bacterium]